MKTYFSFFRGDGTARRSLRLAGLAMAAAGCAGLCGCSPGGAAVDTARAGGVPVVVATALQEDVPVRITAIGNVRAFSTVSVKSRVDGQLAKAGFKEGDEVKQGDLILTIDPRPFQAARDEAEAMMERDTALEQSAEADWKRSEGLEHTKAISATDIDQARAKAESSRATVAADKAALDNAALQLEYCYIHSPIDGRVGTLLVNEGNVVKNNDTVLVVINQLKPVHVDCSVPEKELAAIRRYNAAGPLRVEAAIPNDAAPPAVGELTVIDNAVDASTGTILLRATFPNADEKLWPGQFVNVSLTLTTQRGAVVVPAEAIQNSQNGQLVYVVKPDLTVEARPVVPGRRVGDKIVIEKGLQAQERVVTDGQLRLAPGMKVQVIEDKPGADAAQAAAP